MIDLINALFTLLSLPAPIFCPVKVDKAIPSELKGCCTSCSILDVAVNAATTRDPKVLTTLWRATQDIAISEDCSARGNPSL